MFSVQVFLPKYCSLSNVLRLMCVCVSCCSSSWYYCRCCHFFPFHLFLFCSVQTRIYLLVTMHIIYQSDMLVLLSHSALYTFSQKFTNTYLSFYSVSVCLLVVDVNGYFYILKHRRNFRTCGF